MYKRALLILMVLYSAACFAARPITLTYHIYGVEKKAAKNILDRLNSAQQILGKPLTVDKIKILYRQAPNDIKTALQPYGYFNSTLVNHTLQQSNNNWIASFYINPNEPLTITHITVEVTGEGKNDPEIQKFLQQFPLAAGQVLRTQRYSNAKASLETVAESQGYLAGTFTTHTITIDLQKYTADIVLVYDTGPRYYFGGITFTKTPYDEAFLRRFLPFTTGEPFSNDLIMALQNNLSSSVYFQTVAVKADQTKAVNYQIPVDIALVPRKPHQFSLGVGYGTDTGFRGSLGWEWRQATSTGNYLQAVGQASQVQNNFEIRYVIPGFNPVLQRYEINAGVTTNEPGKGQYRTYQLGGNYVNSFGNWVETLSFSYQHERFNVTPTSGSVLTEYLVPQLSFENVTADSRVNTRNGYRIFLNTQGGSAVNVESQFLQGEVQAKYITTLFSRNRLLFRTDLGYTTVKKIDEFPLSLRFFAGGSQSVRGYGYQSLGPGKNLIVGSGEWQYKLHGKWYSAIFYDFGNAFDNTPLELRKSTGLGIMYQSPMGPIELTIAKPLTDSSNKYPKSLKIEFNIGPDL